MRRVGITLVIALLAGACQYPRDVEGTLERLEAGGVMRVGVSEQEPYVVLDGPEPAGVEVELVEAFADELGAQARYVRGGEEELVEQLHAGELDLVIGGITSRTRWKTEAALTRPYATTHGVVAGKAVTEEHVLLTRMGENALLVRLERHLRAQEDELRAALAEEGER